MQNSKKTIPGREKCILPIVKLPPSLAFRLPKHSYYSGRNITALLLCFFTVVSLYSCTPAKNSVYFSNLQKDTTLHHIITENFDLKIQKNDMLSIAVASLSPDVAFYNAPQNTIGPNNGYLVDENGDIDFVKLGKLHVAGMTRKQLKDTLQNSLVPYLKDVVVSIGFLNRHVTMMGAISPQVLPLPGDNMTILDALAASGGITEKGRMDNVLVIRENEGTKEFKRLNFKNDSVFYSPYYYLQPNDIVYVEPEKARNKISATQVISYVTTGISVLALILTRVIK